MMRMSLSLTSVPLVALLCSAATGCALLERADADIGVGSQQQNDAGPSASGGSPPVEAMGGAAPTDSDGGTQDADLFAGSCPVEPCDPPAGDGDGDASVGGDGDGSTPSGELIENGDFSAGAANWNGTNATVDATSGAGCPVADGLETPIIGWDSVTLEPGSYTFAFDIVGSGDIVAKVGGTMMPWPAYSEHPLPTATAGRQSFEFTMTETATVGVAFIFNSGDACIDNVSLVQN